MKKLNNKGVSLAEVLASITILGIITTSAIFAIQSRGMQLKIINDEFEIKFKLNDASNKYFLTSKDDAASPLYGTHTMGKLSKVKLDLSANQEVVDDIAKATINLKNSDEVIVSYVQEGDKWYTIVRQVELNEEGSGEIINPNKVYDPTKIKTEGSDYPFTDTIKQEQLDGYETIDEELLADAKNDLMKRMADFINLNDTVKQYFSLGKYVSGNLQSGDKVNKVSVLDIQVKTTVGSLDQGSGYLRNDRYYSFYCLLNINSTISKGEPKSTLVAVYGGFRGKLDKERILQCPVDSESRYPISKIEGFRNKPRGAYLTSEYYSTNTNNNDFPKTEMVRLVITDLLVDYLQGNIDNLGVETPFDGGYNVKK